MRFRRGARMVLLFRRFTRRMTPAELAQNVTLLHQSFIRRQLKLEQQQQAASNKLLMGSPTRTGAGSSSSPSSSSSSTTKKQQSNTGPSKRETSNQWKKTIGKVVAVKGFQSKKRERVRDTLFLFSFVIKLFQN
jgi:hypothetical protein